MRPPNMRDDVQSYPCGCHIMRDGDGVHSWAACPLHTAAPKWLAACRIIEASVLPYRGNDADANRTYLCSRASIRQVRAAIATAMPPVEHGGNYATAMIHERRAARGKGQQ